MPAERPAHENHGEGDRVVGVELPMGKIGARKLVARRSTESDFFELLDENSCHGIGQKVGNFVIILAPVRLECEPSPGSISKDCSTRIDRAFGDRGTPTVGAI
jgi:hypothetical protein